MANIYDMADTWNDGLTAFTAIKMNVTDTASASGSLLMDLQVGGSSKFSVRKDGRLSVVSTYLYANPSIGFDSNISFSAIGANLYVHNPSFSVVRFSTNATPFVSINGGGYFGFAAGDPSSSDPDTRLYRDAANTFAQRNSTNAQTFNIYNTYTDASNYERGFMKWNSNEFRIGAESGGTGTNRPVILEATRVVLARAGLVAGDVSFVPRRSNAFDIAQAGGGAPLYQFEAGWLKARYTYQYAWVPSNDANVAADTGLARSAAGVVKVTNGSTGTGELIFIVPTTDPGITGALWNNAGTLSISA